MARGRRDAANSHTNFQRIRRIRCLTLSSYTMAANCASGAKSDISQSS